MPACASVEARTGAGVGKSEEKEPAGFFAMPVPFALWRLRLGAGRPVDLGVGVLAFAGHLVIDRFGLR